MGVFNSVLFLPGPPQLLLSPLLTPDPLSATQSQGKNPFQGTRGTELDGFVMFVFGLDAQLQMRQTGREELGQRDAQSSSGLDLAQTGLLKASACS